MFKKEKLSHLSSFLIESSMWVHETSYTPTAIVPFCKCVPLRPMKTHIFRGWVPCQVTLNRCQISQYFTTVEDFRPRDAPQLHMALTTQAPKQVTNLLQLLGDL